MPDTPATFPVSGASAPYAAGKAPVVPVACQYFGCSAISRVMRAPTCLGSGSRRSASDLLTTAPMLRRQHDLGGQTHEVHGCPSGLLRASASLHQLSFTRLSANTIAAGHRGVVGTFPGSQGCGRSVVHQCGADPATSPVMSDGAMVRDDGEQVLDGVRRGDPRVVPPFEELDGDVVGWGKRLSPR